MKSTSPSEQNSKTRFLLFMYCLTFSFVGIAQTNDNKDNSINPEESIPLEVKSNPVFDAQFNPHREGVNPLFDDLLIGRAVLPAASFAKGPTSGNHIGTTSINEQVVPFESKQPIQGFSAVLNNNDGTFTAMSDNGFGTLENSADYNLRLYNIKPKFRSLFGIGSGDIEVLDFIELRDPNSQIPFAIVNHFSDARVLTGADFDIESVQRSQNGDYWIGDEFGPFILHFDSEGVLLEPPFSLPNFEQPGTDLRAPQNPFNEEYGAQRIMNAMHAHAKANGSVKTPVMSPWFVMLDDGDLTTHVGTRENPPAPNTIGGIRLKKASSEIFKVNSLNKAGFPVVVYTVNDLENMNRLLESGLQGIISDRPDLLLEAVTNFDGNNDGQADYLDEDGLIDISLFDAQGHRGARNLRPENTLPAMEAALDFLMPTLETDCGITKDGVPVLDHDPHIEAAKTRKMDGYNYSYNQEVLVKDLTLEEIQNTFIADKLLNGRPAQSNAHDLSPVSVAFANQKGLLDPYVMPSLQQLFDFVEFYKNYYKNGLGASHPSAMKRWKNAKKVRYNIETKINPRTDRDDRGDVFAERTFSPEAFTEAIASTIVANGLEDRADIQSFDFRTLLLVHKNYPEIRTVCLFGDFPKVNSRGDGTNLQDQNGENTPWLAGLYWPYRTTVSDAPFLVKGSGGFEGMAMTPNGKRLLTLLEKPLVGAPEGELLISEFNINQKRYNGKQYTYQLHEKASAIGDFILYGKDRGLIIERDGSQGDLNGFKSVYDVRIKKNKSKADKKANLDLLSIQDRFNVSIGEPGDIGIGSNFAFPFVTIESVVVFNPFLIGILNDNNYPFSIGRHAGSGLPDDNEFILVWLDEPLGRPWEEQELKQNKNSVPVTIKAYPNTFKNKVTITSISSKKQDVSVVIYDFAGNVIKTLGDKNNAEKTTSFVWDGTTNKGAKALSGVYIAVIESNGKFYKKKLIKN